MKDPARTWNTVVAGAEVDVSARSAVATTESICWTACRHRRTSGSDVDVRLATIQRLLTCRFRIGSRWASPDASWLGAAPRLDHLPVG
jgi:hypothetical protein